MDYEEVYRTRNQRPASEFFEDAQRPDKGRGHVMNWVVGPADEMKRLLDDYLMCGDDRGNPHEWRMEGSPTEYACRRCAVGVDGVGGHTLVFSEESCRIPWSEWRASVPDLTDPDLLDAMNDSDMAWLMYERSTRPKWVVLSEMRVLIAEAKCRGLDISWDATEKRRTTTTVHEPARGYDDQAVCLRLVDGRDHVLRGRFTYRPSRQRLEYCEYCESRRLRRAIGRSARFET